MLTPKPFDLNLIIMGNNQVAFDAVCCAIIGVDPRDGRSHPLRARSAASARSISSKIEITGDVTLDEAQGARQGLQGRAHPRREVLRGHATSPPTPARRPRPSTPTTAGAAARARSKRRSRSCASSTRHCDAKMPRMHVVFGAYDGPIDAKPGEKVVFIGDCANVEGQARRQAGADRERLQGSRAPRIRITPSTSDIYGKMLSRQPR